MAFTVMTKKFTESSFRLPLTDDGSAYLVCKPVLATKIAEITRRATVESGFDVQIASQKITVEMFCEYVTGWHGLSDINGDDVEYSRDMLVELCETDPDFIAGCLDRLRRIAREARLEETKN